METDRICLLNDWRFALTEDNDAVLDHYDDSAFRTLDLPHDWQIENERTQSAPGGGTQGYYPREQMGVYRKRIFAPDAWRGKRVRVLFDGVQRFSSVYLNGTLVGGRPYGYVPFTCELTDALCFGQENLLAVREDNRSVPGEAFGGGDRWYSGAGIYRNVYLLVDEESHIAHNGVRVVTEPVHRGPSRDVPDVNGIRCDLAHIRVSVEICAPKDGQSVHVQALNDSSEQVVYVCASASARVEFAFDLSNPCLWSPDTPALYSLRVSLCEGERELDAHSLAFGVRSAVFDSEDGFLLNGKKCKLFGVNFHHDAGAVGAAVPKALIRRRLLAVKAMGANTVRASHNPQAEEFYELCDELGLMVIDEIYDKWADHHMYFDRFFEEYHASDLEAMIRRDANHPCVILWSVGNEIGYQYSEAFYARLKELCTLTRALDPTRAVTAALIGFVLPDFHDLTPMGRKLDAVLRYAEIVDVFSGNYMEHFYEKLRAVGMRKPIIGTEVRTYYRLDEKAMDSVTITNESPFTICKKYDWVCGAILWAGADYLGESSGWPARGWTGCPMDSTSDWKLRAWYCAAQWRSDPVLKLAVYDESEPWDTARGLWGFPQMRSHWNYTQYEKVLHVVAMTNCDTVKVYQNSQTVRVAHLRDFPDGMIHFYIPFLPGILRAEGFMGGQLVMQDTLYSDHAPNTLRIVTDKDTLTADGRDVALIDVLLEDAHGRRYMLINPSCTWRVEGDAHIIAADNGDAMRITPLRTNDAVLNNGHIMLILRAGREKGEAKLTVCVEGFAPQTLSFTLV